MKWSINTVVNHPVSSGRLVAHFFARFSGKLVIVHAGFPEGWFEELLKQPGGGGCFRFDSRLSIGVSPTPIEWVVQQEVLPLALPMPLLMKVEETEIILRHLLQDGRIAKHPSEILWMLDEINERFHFRLHFDQAFCTAISGIPVEDNGIDTPYGQF